MKRGVEKKIAAGAHGLRAAIPAVSPAFEISFEKEPENLLNRKER